MTYCPSLPFPADLSLRPPLKAITVSLLVYSGVKEQLPPLRRSMSSLGSLMKTPNRHTGYQPPDPVRAGTQSFVPRVYFLRQFRERGEREEKDSQDMVNFIYLT